MVVAHPPPTNRAVDDRARDRWCCRMLQHAANSTTLHLHRTTERHMSNAGMIYMCHGRAKRIASCDWKVHAPTRIQRRSPLAPAQQGQWSAAFAKRLQQFSPRSSLHVALVWNARAFSLRDMSTSRVTVALLTGVLGAVVSASYISPKSLSRPYGIPRRPGKNLKNRMGTGSTGVA